MRTPERLCSKRRMKETPQVSRPSSATTTCLQPLQELEGMTKTGGLKVQILGYPQGSLLLSRFVVLKIEGA